MVKALSHVIGAAAPPLLEQTIGQALDAAAARWPDGVALISPRQGVRWTWAQLKARVDALACGLIGHGLKRGDRVGIWALNRAEWTLVQFATAKAGLILVTINPAYRTSEVEYALNKVGCVALVTAVAYKSSDYVAMLREIGPERLANLQLVVTLGDEEHAGFVPFARLSATVDVDMLNRVGASLAANDPINIQFTSGTTGFPKGATLTHRNILNNGLFVGRQIGLTPTDRICIPVPLYHCFGMVLGNLASVTSGATMVYPAEAFDPLAVLQAVASERCTALYGVPTMFISILNHPDFAGFDVSSLRTGIMAGSPCPVATMLDVVDRLHMPEVTIGYGMTETSPISFQSAVDDPIAERVSTVGRIMPHLEVKIIDPRGRTVPIGETGELCTRGYSVMQGYWDDPERTAESIDAEDWMHSGDLATLDDKGYGRITGRIKDMIIRGGENIYPREIEEFLLTHLSIVDAQVFGVPSEKFGEEVCVWIMPRAGAALTEEDVRAFCRGKIAHYKIPLHVRFVTEFPMTVTGKIQKFEMRRMMSVGGLVE